MMNNKYYIQSFTLKDEIELGFVEIKHCFARCTEIYQQRKGTTEMCKRKG